MEIIIRNIIFKIIIWNKDLLSKQSPWSNTMLPKQIPCWDMTSGGMNEADGAQHNIWTEPTNSNIEFHHFYYFPIIVLTTVPPFLYQLLYLKFKLLYC